MNNEPPIVFDQVWKAFRRGERHDSLRDLVPAMARRLLGRRPRRDDRSFWALREVGFRVERGEALGIIGPNGAGKSTILKILSRIMRPDRGSARVTGRLSSLIEVGAGFHWDLTGRENIYLNGAILGMSRREMDEKFDAIVDFAELPDFIDTPIKRYSSGMQARLGFSVAAHMDPDVLLVDEVLSVGDYHFQTRCFERMRRFIESGVTVIFVSHNMNSVGALCDRCVLLDGGRVAYQGKTAEAIQRYYACRQQHCPAADGAAASAVRIENWKLEDQDGHQAAVFRNGQRVRLTAEITADVDLSVSVGLVLQSAGGVIVADTATTRLTNEMVELRADGRYQVAFEFTVRFCPGTYFLSINVEDPLLRRYHAFARNLASFEVVDGQECGGICFIEPSVQVRAIPADPTPAERGQPSATHSLEPLSSGVGADTERT